MLRARALKAGSAAGFPGSMLLTESLLIKIFQLEHEARGRGSGERSRGDVLAGLWQGWRGWLGCLGAGRRPQPIPLLQAPSPQRHST